MILHVFLHVLVMFAILVLINVPAPFLGLKFEANNESKLWYAPPGFVIPIVWFILFTLLGIALYIVRSIKTSFGWDIILLGVLCASYAYYTLGLAKITGISALWFGLFGNIVVIIVAFIVCWRLFPISTAAGALTFPVIAWTAYASLIVLGELKLEKLL